MGECEAEGEESLSEDEWRPEYDNWEEKEGDFTKKLNAARVGLGGNNEQGSSSLSANKSLHVSH